MQNPRCCVAVKLGHTFKMQAASLTTLKPHGSFANFALLPTRWTIADLALCACLPRFLTLCYVLFHYHFTMLMIMRPLWAITQPLSSAQFWDLYIAVALSVCVCVCVCAEVTEVYDIMSCISIAIDRAATREQVFRVGAASKYFL